MIPNTELERLIKERGVELDAIDSSYFVIPPRVGNLLLYVLCLWRPPGTRPLRPDGLLDLPGWTGYAFWRLGRRGQRAPAADPAA